MGCQIWPFRSSRWFQLLVYNRLPTIDIISGTWYHCGCMSRAKTNIAINNCWTLCAKLSCCFQICIRLPHIVIRHLVSLWMHVARKDEYCKMQHFLSFCTELWTTTFGTYRYLHSCLKFHFYLMMDRVYDDLQHFQFVAISSVEDYWSSNGNL
jgi:hypothetical protein